MISGQSMHQALRTASARTLILTDSGGLSGIEIDASIQALAAAIRARASAKSKVGVWYWNSSYALVAHLAVERAGLTRVPVDPSAALAEAKAIFVATDVDLVIVDVEHADATLGEILVYDEGHDIPKRESLVPIDVDDDSIAVIFPRMVSASGLLAVPLTFCNWEARMAFSQSLYRRGVYGPIVTGSDCYLTTQQMTHGTGVIGTFPFLYLGLPQVILKRFETSHVIEACLKFGVTTTFMVPGMVARLADAMRSRIEVLPLTRLLYGGAPITKADLVDAVEILGPILVQLYGSIEGGWPLTYLNQADHLAIARGTSDIEGSCGRAVPGVDLAIRTLGNVPGGRGELRVSGPTVSSSYVDPDGWCSLGDVADRDAAGYYRLYGRLDGMINTGSYHVYPAEVEEAIRALLPVRSVSVVSEPDPKWGEAVTANLTWAPDSTFPTDQELRKLLGARLAKYKIPTRIRHQKAHE